MANKLGQHIAVLLTVYNRKEKTKACLQALYKQELPSDTQTTVFLTNDGCTDGTPEMVKSLFPQVHIVEGDGQLFWNRGMRKAWEAAVEQGGFSYYLWLNDDTVLEEDAIIKLVHEAETQGNEHIVVGSTVALNNDSELTYGGRNLKGQLIEPANAALPCAYFNGNIVLIPQKAFAKVGFNDNVFRHALGDYDYGRRAHKLGVKSWIAPGILGKCDEHADAAIWCNAKYPFAKRWKYFRTPLGQNPEEYFVYDLRHNGLISACFHYFTIHLRLFLPAIWPKYRQQKAH